MNVPCDCKWCRHEGEESCIMAPDGTDCPVAYIDPLWPKASYKKLKGRAKDDYTERVGQILNSMKKQRERYK